MSQSLTMGHAPASHAFPRAARAVPNSPFRVRVLYPRREPAWREAMRWSLIGLTASWAAGEVTLLLLGL